MKIARDEIMAAFEDVVGGNPDGPVESDLRETIYDLVNNPISKGALIVEERAALYGSPVPQMSRLALGFSAILGAKVTALQVAMLMVFLKVVREAHGEHQDDNLDDIEGYVEIARRVVNEGSNDPAGS